MNSAEAPDRRLALVPQEPRPDPLLERHGVVVPAGLRADSEPRDRHVSLAGALKLDHDLARIATRMAVLDLDVSRQVHLQRRLRPAALARAAAQGRQPRGERRLDGVVGGVCRLVLDLVGVGLEVVELDLTAHVLDVDVAVGVHRGEGAALRGAVVVVVDHVPLLDQQLAAVQTVGMSGERKQRAPVLGQPGGRARGVDDGRARGRR